MGAKLGEGRFGQVREATHRETNKIFAVKILDLRGPSDYQNQTVDSDQLKKHRQEASALERMGAHSHCVRLIEAFQERCLYYIVTERCELTLMDMLEQIPLTGEANLARVFREMLLAIAHVHDAGFMHRDIKPNNYLFESDMQSHVKLADFGMAVAVPKRGELKGQYGTTPYMSPEMVGDKAYSQKTDIWSYGVSIYVLLFGDFPYRPPQQEEASKATKQLILSGTPEPTFASPEGSFAPQPSPAAITFVRAMMVRSHKERPTTSEALQQAFIAEGTAHGVQTVESPSSLGVAPSPMPSPMHKECCQRIRELQAKVDRRDDLIAQRDLDCLLQKLQGKRRSFTEDIHDKEPKLMPARSLGPGFSPSPQRDNENTQLIAADSNGDPTCPKDEDRSADAMIRSL
jgi:serine/threonine protein kinase